MPLPQWLQEHLETNDPIADLRRLGRWLDDDENRTTWHTVRAGRETAERETDAKLRDRLGGLTIGETVILNGKVKDAKARHMLAGLALKLAESTRLRTAMTLRSPVAEAADEQWVRVQAAAINTGVRMLLTLLTEAAFRYPVEIVPTAVAVLGDLTNNYDARMATREPKDLEAWAEAVNAAVEILTSAPATRS
ncbi:hypothetical protein [Kitasatospora sp. NPDC127060]|uniref:hypothetical protein n=1 Tax=Kitasatospora sp. NPDC127060 TaxID=3347121 RepID=UPI00365CC065